MDNFKTLVATLKKAFSNKKGVLLETKDGELLTVIPHALAVNGSERIYLTVSDDGVNNVRELLLDEVVSVTEVEALIVPVNIASSTEYWSSRFFSIPVDYAVVDKSAESASGITFDDTESPMVSAEGSVANVQESVVSEEPFVPNSNYPSQGMPPTPPPSPYYPAQNLGAPLSNPYNNPNPYGPGQGLPHGVIPDPPKKTGKIALIAVGVSVLLVVVGGVAIVNLVNNTFGSGGSAADDAESEAWLEAREEWDETTNPEDYYTGSGPVSLTIDSTEQLTEYDSFGWWGPYLTSDEAEDAYDPNDVIPDGWSKDNLWEIPTGYVLPGETFDPSINNQDSYLYENTTEGCSAIVYSALISVSKMSTLGSTDAEVTENIMNELVVSTEGQEPEIIRFSEWYEPEGFVEFQEYVYEDLSGEEYHFALRAMQSNGSVMVVANNCGYSNSQLVDEGILLEVDANLEYPYLGSERN